MKNDTISIEFVGQDYSPLNNAVENAKLFIGENKDEIPKENDKLLWTFSTNNKLLNLTEKSVRRILIKYLESIDTSKLIVNKSPDSTNNVKKIYSPDFKDGYFSGLAGVIQGKITMSESELIDDYDTRNNSDNTADYHFNVKLQIQSRLDTKSDGTIGKPYFLSTMLLRDSIKLNDDTVPNSEDELYDYLLLFWFKEQLQNAYLKGFFRTYRRFERNDDRLKGSIDIARHIRLNMGQRNGKIAYSYRENTIDNYLNHMIIASYDYLKKKYYNLVVDNFDNTNTLKSAIDSLRSEIGYSDFSSYSLISRNMKPISHPFYTEYEELRKTCMKILRDEGLSIFNGEDTNETKGILVYLPDLWENFVEDFIRNSLRNTDINVIPQKTVKVFGYLGHNEVYTQETRPDYILETINKNFMILDAKFKPKWDAIFDRTSISDVLEDYDKCMRDMVDINSFAAGVIFPTNKNTDISKEIVCHKISKENQISRFYTFPAYVPHSDAQYSIWSTEMQLSIQKTMNFLLNVAKHEKEFYNIIQEEHRKLYEAREALEASDWFSRNI